MRVVTVIRWAIGLAAVAACIWLVWTRLLISLGLN